MTASWLHWGVGQQEMVNVVHDSKTNDLGNKLDATFIFFFYDVSEI